MSARGPLCACGCKKRLTAAQMAVAASRGVEAKWASAACKRRATRRRERAKAKTRPEASTASAGPQAAENDDLPAVDVGDDNPVAASIDAMLANLCERNTP